MLWTCGIECSAVSVWWCLGGRAADPAAVRANQALHLDGGGGLHRGGGVHLRSSTGTQAWSFFYFATFMRAPLPLPLEWFLTQQHVLIIIYIICKALLSIPLSSLFKLPCVEFNYLTLQYFFCSVSMGGHNDICIALT